MDIANVERAVEASGTPRNQDQVRSYLERRRELENNYDKFLSGLKLYGGNLTEEERLILRVTRMFGECELVAPREYLAEVGRFIKRWQSTGRYVRASSWRRKKVRRNAEELIPHNLQRSSLHCEERATCHVYIRPPLGRVRQRNVAVHSETGERYGLTSGPLGIPRPDPADERSNGRSPGAAARYFKDIYATDAQASAAGMLDNWGEGGESSDQAMPHPRCEIMELLGATERVPRTYNYVFSIVSAAVIGETLACRLPV